jgi:hypothetical protein
MYRNRSCSIVISMFFVVCFVLLSGCTSDNSNNNSNGPSWMNNYTPTYSVGTGTNNFWINFPPGNPSAGQSVTHKTWITDDVKEKPVIFVCHRTGCVSCTPQADRVKALRDIYGEDAVFYDLDDNYDGSAPDDILQKYYEAFYYDPNGEPNYIALTGVFTLINDGTGTKIGWHSWEGNVGDSEMESWVKDCIYYYHING